jgi:chromosome segregation ATPase
MNVESVGEPKLLIREIILENFMSYEYARIPLKQGLNIVCGPNGSGKSSILLAISIALGQSHTERSRRLSDLIRWGENGARITLEFDNSPNSGKRPVPEFDADYFRITRYLKNDGNYWFEANFQTITKTEVTSILNKIGLDPDNMLIIMHQNTMEEFSTTNPNQKLRMFEEAIGLAKHRQNILEAQQKLTQVLSEEESVKNLLENAEQTLAYWKNEYERYQRRRELLQKKSFLERELIWAQVTEQVAIIDSWQKKVERKEHDLDQIENELDNAKKLITNLNDDLNASNFEQRKAFYSLLAFEKEKTEHETVTKIQTTTLAKLAIIDNLLQTQLTSSPTYQLEYDDYTRALNAQIPHSKARVKELGGRIAQTQIELTKIEEMTNSLTTNYLDARVRAGLLDFRMKLEQDALAALNVELRVAKQNLELLKPRLEEASPKIETTLSPQEVAEEIKILNIQLMSLGRVSEEVEKMHSTYLALFNELKTKAEAVSENRTKTLREISARKTTWMRLVHSTLDEVSTTYQKLLSRIGASGSLRLTSTHDIETAGLELMVGFKGAEPKILDSYTQSGGERSAATMAFLLALQQHLKSPFRAVDEFDVHMDPVNREVISDMLFEEISKNREIQYITITPGQITNLEKDVHVITVQNSSGQSEVKVMPDVE